MKSFRRTLRILAQWLCMFMFFLPYLFSVIHPKKLHLADMITGTAPELAKNPFFKGRVLQKAIAVTAILVASLSIMQGALSTNPVFELFSCFYDGMFGRILLIGTGCLLWSGSYFSLKGTSWGPILLSGFFLLYLASTGYSFINIRAYTGRAQKNFTARVNAVLPSIVQDPKLIRLTRKPLLEMTRQLPQALKRSLKIYISLFAFLFLYQIHLLIRLRNKSYDSYIHMIPSRIMGLITKLPGYLPRGAKS